MKSKNIANENDGEDAGKAVVSVLWASGCIGALYGLGSINIYVLMPQLRFLAGMVAVPMKAPGSAILLDTTTPFSLFLAGMLRAGLPELFIYAFLSCLICAIYAQALSLIAFAYSRHVYFAVVVGVAAVITGAFLQGADYPIELTLAIPGNFGLGFAILAISFLHNRMWGGISLLVPLTATVHPTLAAVLMVLTALVMYSERQASAIRLRLDLLGTGLLVAVLGWISVWMWVPQIPMQTGDPTLFMDYMDLWDYHRNRPFDLRAAMIVLQVMAVVTAAAVNRRGMRTASLTTTYCGLIGIASYIGFHVLRPYLHLTPTILIAMPNRLLNLPEVMTLPVVGGILFNSRGLLARVSLLALAIGVAAWVALTWTQFHSMPTMNTGILGSLFVSTLAVVSCRGATIPMNSGMRRLRTVVVNVGLEASRLLPWRRGVSEQVNKNPDPDPDPDSKQRPWRIAMGNIMTVLRMLWQRNEKPAGEYGRRNLLHFWFVVGVVSIVVGIRSVAKVGYFIDLKRSQESILERVNDGSPILSLDRWIPEKMFVSNPSVIDITSLDGAAYVTRVLPTVAKLLGDVYDIDFRNPPPALRQTASLIGPDGLGPAIDSKSTKDWQRLADIYGFKYIIADSTRQLPLPVEVKVRSLTIYKIQPNHLPIGGLLLWQK
ncbi:MAG: hypothetical protein H7840_16435 [Alphaproteobacteria bacterium]